MERRLLVTGSLSGTMPPLPSLNGVVTYCNYTRPDGVKSYGTGDPHFSGTEAYMTL